VSAERALVGSILRHGSRALEAGAGDLQIDHISEMKLRGLFSLLMARFERGESLDYQDVIVDDKAFSGPIGVDTVTLAWEASPASVDSVPSLLREVTSRGIRRSLEAAVAEASVESSLEDYTASLLHLAEAAREATPTVTAKNDIWEEALRRICALQDGSEVPDGIPTGFGTLDNLLGGGGILPGQITVLAARPGVGKSSLARQIALNAVRSGRGAAIFSLEDGPFTYACRVFADGTDISLGRLRRGRVSKEELQAVHRIVHEMKNSPIDLVCVPGLSSRRIASMVRLRKRVAKCDLVVVDYVNLIKEPGKERRDQIDNAIRTLVEMARLQNVAVLLCAQLNRNSVTESRRPGLHDLKESGSLEQEGKAVILVDRKHKSEEATVQLEKNNQGDVGDVKMIFNSGTTSFREVDVITQEQEEF
jgi:replicative DNA helicase